jgi:hypothetical protein
MVSWTKQTRLNDNDPTKTWCGSSTPGEFFRLNFGSVKVVRSIYIQGHPGDAKWVTEITIRYSTDGIFFKDFSGYYNKKVRRDYFTVCHLERLPSLCMKSKDELTLQ